MNVTDIIRDTVEECAALNERLAGKYEQDAKATGDPILAHTCTGQAMALRAAAMQIRATIGVKP